MDITLLQQPLFQVGHHYVTVLGLVAFVGFFAAGLIIARFLQGQIVRRFFSRFKIDTNFMAMRSREWSSWGSRDIDGKAGG